MVGIILEKQPYLEYSEHWKRANYLETTKFLLFSRIE